MQKVEMKKKKTNKLQDTDNALNNKAFSLLRITKRNARIHLFVCLSVLYFVVATSVVVVVVVYGDDDVLDEFAPYRYFC